MLVKGLDRTDDNEALADMPDDLWSQHTEEVRRSFAELPAGSISFKDFCYKYYTGESTTNAMRIWANLKAEESK
jgi:hypothetical protein